MVRAAGGEVRALEFAAAEIGEASRVRREGELEADVRELLGVLSLPGGASDVIEGFALRFGGERSDGRAVSRRVHEDQQGEEPDDEWRGVCDGNRSAAFAKLRCGRRGQRAGFLLFDFSKH